MIGKLGTVIKHFEKWIEKLDLDFTIEALQKLVLSLKSETNAVTISLIVPRKDNLNNKAKEVNSRLINMCGEHDITFIYHTDTIELKDI